jgi:hypothetical protein
LGGCRWSSQSLGLGDRENALCTKETDEPGLLLGGASLPKGLNLGQRENTFSEKDLDQAVWTSRRLVCFR